MEQVISKWLHYLKHNHHKHQFILNFGFSSLYCFTIESIYSNYFYIKANSDVVKIAWIRHPHKKGKIESNKKAI